MDIQTSHLSVQNHVNIVTNDQVFMFTPENYVNTMTSEVCMECMSVDVFVCSDVFWTFNRIIK